MPAARIFEQEEMDFMGPTSHQFDAVRDSGYQDRVAMLLPDWVRATLNIPQGSD